MRSIKRILPILLLAAFAAACGKAPAEAALKASDTALEAARPQVEKFVPAEWKSLSDESAAARAEFEKGNYKEALTAAQGLLPKIQAAVTAAGARKQELTASFEGMKASLPATLDALGKQLEAYAAMKKLPAGLDKATVTAAQADLPNVTQAWGEATTAFESGDLMKAVDSGMAVKGKVEAMVKTFMPTATAQAPPAS
ncbi:MAG: hypothetical protein NDJ94_15230 [Vicinamibacteria bacterium]|nr:hypothetical protein [Vicinamibacteria bacterium]